MSPSTPPDDPDAPLGTGPSTPPDDPRAPLGTRRTAVEFLFSLERFGMKFGLANIARLCAALGHPEAAFPSIVIAGTNGKGSVTAMVDTGLRAAGHRSARYTSPHLQRLEERFVIDGREVAPDVLDRAAALVQHTAETLVGAGELATLPTFFEATTAVAFVLFRDAKVDIAVLEVGLGGRLDATNIVTPIAVAIVSIDFDHQEQLGTTIAAIATEKAGVIKPGIPVVCGPVPADALQVIAAVCAERRATLIRTDTDGRLAGRIASMSIALPGEHQKANAGVALRLLEAIDDDTTLELRVGADAMRAAVAEVRWPGRLESFTLRGCRVLIDAAHNAAGARALAAHLWEVAPSGVTLVFGAMQDKAITEMLSALSPVVRSVVCTTAPNPRAMTADELLLLASSLGMRAEVIADPVSAVGHACAAGVPVVVAGSIFLIGPVREWLARDILR